MNVVDLDRRAALGTAAVVDSTSPDQHGAPTPCTDWTVRDLLTHLIAGNVKYVDVGRGKEWARGAPDVVLDDDPGGMYRRSLDALLNAWVQPGALDRDTARSLFSDATPLGDDAAPFDPSAAYLGRDVGAWST